MLKSIFAIIVSYVAMFVLFMAIFTGLYFALGIERVLQPDSYEVSTLWLVLTLVGSFIGSLLGGWLCVAISKSFRTGQVYALIVFLATLVACMSAMSRDEGGPNVRAGEVSFRDAMERSVMPRWAHFLNPPLAAVGALVGAQSRRRRLSNPVP